MKRWIAGLFITFILFSCTACREEPNMENPVQFYYVTSELSFRINDTVICPETRDIPGMENPTALMQLYLHGTTQPSLRSPFPAQLELLQMQIQEETLILVFSQHLAQLTGLELMIACSCITLTATELTNTETVMICADGVHLDGQEQITMDRSTILLRDTSIPKED